jgi:O-antigen/teichoic acid export membrane protein
MSAPLGIVLFADLNKTFNSDIQKMKKRVNSIVIKLMVLGTLITLLYFMTIKFQIIIIGELPAYAKEMFTIMAFSIPFLISIGGIGNIFVIIDRLKEALVFSIVSLFVSIMCYFICIYFKNIQGLSIAYLIIAVFNLIFSYLYFMYLLNRIINNRNN